MSLSNAIQLSEELNIIVPPPLERRPVTRERVNPHMFSCLLPTSFCRTYHSYYRIGKIAN